MSLCLALEPVAVYQLLALKEKENTLGSTLASVHLEAALFAQPFARKMVLIDLSAFNPSSFDQILSKKAAAVLVVLDTVHKLGEFYQVLQSKEI